MALSKTTQDHEEIKQWAEARGAKPCEVASTHSGNQTGILRFEFPDAPHHNDAALQEISWDEFFEKFDANGLELIYQDVTAEGAQSNFNKLIYPEDEHASGAGSRKKTSSSTRASSGTGSRTKSPGAKKSASGSSRSNGSRSTGKSASSSRTHATGKGSSSKSGTSKKSSGRSTAAKKTSSRGSSSSSRSGSRRGAA